MNYTSPIPVQYFSNDPSPEMWWTNLTETTLKMEIEQDQDSQIFIEEQSAPFMDAITLETLASKYMISSLEIYEGTVVNERFLKYLEKNYQIFKNIYQSFEKNDRFLKHKNGRTVGINAVQLMKVTAKALTVLQENQSTYIQLDSQSPQLLVTRQEEGFLVIGHKIKELNRGSEGIVYLFDVVTKPVLMTAKFLNDNLIGAIEREVTALKILYDKTDKSSLEGIQDQIYSTFWIKERQDFFDGNEIPGYITSYYEKGWVYSVLPSKNLQGVDALSVIRQLFEGIRQAHALNLVHNDIAARNLLIRLDRDKFEIFLADWGCSEICESEDEKAIDIYDLCIALYEILTGVRKSEEGEKKICAKTRQQLLTLHAECRDSILDFVYSEERVGIFEQTRLKEIGIPNNLIELFTKAISPSSLEEYPKPEAFIQVIDSILSKRVEGN